MDAFSQMIQSMFCNTLPQQQQVNTEKGLNDLQAHCASIYTQPNRVPLCLRPSKSFIREGGSDPLDYIYIFYNEGQPERSIPRHWHYIGFGLSDIYGYGMLCDMAMIARNINPVYTSRLQNLVNLYPNRDIDASMRPGPDRLSGFGFELTFRLRCDSDESWSQDPPKWPGLMMQALARYVFQSKNTFKAGDHVSWHCSLDGKDDSRIEHLLMTLDPQLDEANTSFGKVRFIQLVGVCQEELQSARELNVKEVLEILRERLETGGEFLVTDMTRGATMFELNPDNYDRINERINRLGSDMTMISTKHKYSSRRPRWFEEVEALESEDDHRRYNLLLSSSDPETIENSCEVRTPSRMSYESESALMVENAELIDTRFYDCVYLLLSYETAKVLPIAINGRLSHQRHFSFQSFKGDLLTTFVPEGAAIESLVSPEQPFARRGTWLQIYVPIGLIEQMREQIMRDFTPSTNEQTILLPKNYSWPEYKLYITIVEKINESSSYLNPEQDFINDVAVDDSPET